MGEGLRVAGQLADKPNRGQPNRGLVNSRTGQFADWSTRGLVMSRLLWSSRGLDNSRTSQPADWTIRGLVNSRTSQLADAVVISRTGQLADKTIRGLVSSWIVLST